jgi:peptide/nickel transport system substrate-binding protein
MAQARTSRKLRPRTLRSVALFAGGVLAVPVLAGCSADETERTGRAVAQDIAATPRASVGNGGTLRWAVDALPTTLNAFQADADAATARITGAVLPALFTLDRSGHPVRNPDYVESVSIVEREPKQVVLYKLNQRAVWSDGREIGAPDFVAQWRALRGTDSTYWTARNAGYDRIEHIQKGASDLEVRVTFSKPYADWQSLFSPLYPKETTGTPSAFNDGARTTLTAMAGPFQLASVDRAAGTATLVRNPRWWGDQTKLERLVFTAVPREKRAAALAAGRLDLAEIDRGTADRISLAVRNRGTGGQQPGHGPGAALTPSAALRSWALANGSDAAEAEAARKARERTARTIAVYGAEQSGLRGFTVRKSLEPAYTQLALNGESGPLADDRVRRAIARALDRRELAETVLRPLGLPAVPPGSHLALAGQRAYTDNSGALGEQSTQEAQALLADAGWTPGGALRKPEPAKAGGEAGATPGTGTATAVPDGGKNGRTPPKQSGSAGTGEDGKNSDNPATTGTGEKKENEEPTAKERTGAADVPSDEGLYIVSDKNTARSDPSQVLAPAAVTLEDLSVQRRAGQTQGRAAGTEQAGDNSSDGKEPGKRLTGAYAPAGTAAPVAAGGRLGKDGKALSLRFVLPSGPASEQLRTVGEKIARMLDRIGVQTQITKVPDASYFKDHIASGNYDLALYSWPATAYPATDARPIYAKPEPAADGSLLVEQNYTRVGTDYIDQLFDQAAAELDEAEARDLVRRADARIWAAAGSIPLYQRPELVAARSTVLNAGAFGFATPRYQDVGFTPASLRGASGAVTSGAGAPGAPAATATPGAGASGTPGATATPRPAISGTPGSPVASATASASVPAATGTPAGSAPGRNGGTEENETGSE